MMEKLHKLQKADKDLFTRLDYQDKHNHTYSRRCVRDRMPAPVSKKAAAKIPSDQVIEARGKFYACSGNDVYRFAGVYPTPLSSGEHVPCCFSKPKKTPSRKPKSQKRKSQKKRSRRSRK